MASTSTKRRGGSARRAMPAYARPTRVSLTRMLDRGDPRSTEARLRCPEKAYYFENMASRTSPTPPTNGPVALPSGAGMLGMYPHDRAGRTVKGRGYRPGQVGVQGGRAPSQILQSRIRQLARGIKDKHSNNQSLQSSRESVSVATEFKNHKMAENVIDDSFRTQTEATIRGAAGILRSNIKMIQRNGNIDSRVVLERNVSSHSVKEEGAPMCESSTSRYEPTDSESSAVVQPTPQTSPAPNCRARRSAVFQIPPDRHSELLPQFAENGQRRPDVPSTPTDETDIKEVSHFFVQSKDKFGSCLSSASKTTRHELQPLVVEYPPDLPARYQRSFPAPSTPNSVVEFSCNSPSANREDRMPSDTLLEKDLPSSPGRSRSLDPTPAGSPLLNRRPSSSGPIHGRSTSVTNISRAYKARRRSVFGLGLASSAQGTTGTANSSSSTPGPRRASVAEIFRRSRQSRQQRLSVYLQSINQGKESAIERLRRVSKTVRIIIGICLALKSYVKTSESRQWSLIEMHLNIRADMEKTLAFDPVMFAKLRVTRGSEKLRSILSTKRSERTKEDIEVVLALLRKNKTFADYNRNTQMALAKVMEYLKYEPRRIILKEGHKASGFYIILSGTCLINQKDLDPRNNEPFVRTIDEIHSGDSFGDMELLSDCTRTVSVVCKDECEVLLVDKEDFNTIIRAPLERERDELISFCNTQNVFEKLPTSMDFQGYYHAISAKKFKPGVVITSDISESDFIYVIRSGKCRVISEIREMKKKHPTDKKKARKLKRSWTVIEPLRDDGKLIPDSELFRTLRHNTFLSVTEKMPSGEDTYIGSKVPVIPESIFEEKDRLQTKPYHDEPVSATLHQVRAAASVTSDQKHNNRMLFLNSSRLKSTYAEVAMLKKGDLFGLETLMTNSQSDTRLSLMSEGTECIVISKKFFAAHATASAYFHRSTKRIIEYPSAQCTLDKIRQARAWSSYKDSVVRDVCSQKIAKASNVSR